MKTFLLILTAAIIFFQTAFSQAGNLDKSFGDNGVAKIPVMLLNPGTTTANKIVQLSNGKFIVSVSVLGHFYDVYIYRLGENGNIDSSFAVNGRKVIHSGLDMFFLYDFFVDSNNNIIISTSKDNYDYGSGFKLSRLLPNGDKDNSFGNHGAITVDHIPNLRPYRSDMLSLQPDGKILASATAYPSDFAPFSSYLFRFTKNGSPDSSFNNKGYVYFENTVYDEYSRGDLYYHSATQPNNRILCFGTAITELKSDGKPVKNFGDSNKIYGDSTEYDNATFKERFSCINLLAGGGFMCIGSYNVENRYGDGNVRHTVYKFKKDGTPDSAFGVNGEYSINHSTYSSEYYNPEQRVEHLTVQPDEKFILTNGYQDGNQFYHANKISRYLLNGSIDSSFGKNGSINKKAHNISGIVLQKDLKIVTLDNLYPSSSADTNYFYLYRYKNDADTFSFTSASLNKETIQVKPSIKIFPNPVTNSLNISGLAGSTKLSIINADGNLMASATASVSYKWNIQNLAAGNYFIVAAQGGKTIASLKFIKQ